jgi:hypothetical protein
MTNTISQASSNASKGYSTPMPCRIIKSNLGLSRAPVATNKITDNNSHTRHNQRAITSEGGHTLGAIHHLPGCPLALGDSLPATCPKTTSAEWRPPTWPSPSETTIGIGSTKQKPSSTPSPEKKWNTWHL